jgi:hypothetical protein
MRRLHLFEIEDQPWCPRAVRDGGTDWLRFMSNTLKGFNAIAPKLRAAMERVGCNRVLDLCSGGGGPWLSLAPVLAQSGTVHVDLTDFYPNLPALRRVCLASNGSMSYCHERVDATAVPAELEGVRTLFNSFHHFRPCEAQAIIADAVKKQRGIVVVEGADNRFLGIIMILLMPFMMLALTHRIRPFRWSRLILTYLLPVIPLLGLFDGIVSMLRIYTPPELRELVAQVSGADEYDWDIGSQPVEGSPLGLTYLVGVPRAKA